MLYVDRRGGPSAVLFDVMPHFSPPARSLVAFAWFTTLATLGLIGLGGLVTSHGAGMAVPDWPTTYGYNMFLFPVSQWVGGILYEHTHRLWASVVGLLTVILAVWIQLQVSDRRLKRLGWFAVGLVIFQGLLGGLRVSLMKDQIGVFHAALAQSFLCLLVLISVFLSPGWARWKQSCPEASATTLRWTLAAVVMIFAQLVLGATMRHQHAGLAVPDFPLAYGHVWPPTDDAFLQTVNAGRVDTRDFHPITATHVYLHMAHRGMGMLVGVVVWVAGWSMIRSFRLASVPGRMAAVWMGTILVQIALGAWTVWSNKAADVATLHVVVGALALTLGVCNVAWSRVAVGTRYSEAQARTALGASRQVAVTA